MRKFYIVNDCDRPAANHITERRDDGLHYYIHPDLLDKKRYHGMDPASPTPLEDFGIDVTITGGVFHGHQARPSTAAYKDGKPRQWQGDPEFHFPTTCKP